MPLAKLKYDFDQELPAGPRGFQSGSDHAAAASPARMLQHQLEMHNAAAIEPFVQKWPLRRAAAFIVISSLALWMAILTAATQLYHAVG